MSPKKTPPVIPVVGGGGAGDSSREAELLAWEEQERARREAAAVSAVQPAFPAQPPAPGAATTAETATSSSTEVAAQEETPGYLSVPEFTEPDSDDPAERLEHYSRGIYAAEYAARANHERAEQQKLIAQGLRLRAIKEEELHKDAGFDTFGALTEALYGIKKHQANNILRVLGVVQALEHITTQELKERPLRPLVPILDTHGAEAVRETWTEASRHGNVTENALREAANFLGYGIPKELDAGGQEGKKSPAAPKPKEAALIVQRLRSLAEKDRARAREEARELQRAIEELVDELSADA
ncbi:hypothetical protein ACFW81_24070 [Streptomyces angustmyceticus]|uniref:hypothetical protein n=1 Tax=Streptomyces angustmyceticus TaxID=285578 RepID=UPI0036CD3ED1